MTALGFALLLTGAILVVAEAHLPGGILDVADGVAARGWAFVASGRSATGGARPQEVRGCRRQML